MPIAPIRTQIHDPIKIQPRHDPREHQQEKKRDFQHQIFFQQPIIIASRSISNPEAIERKSAESWIHDQRKQKPSPISIVIKKLENVRQNIQTEILKTRHEAPVRPLTKHLAPARQFR
jgi:hypothetical protein